MHILWHKSNEHTYVAFQQLFMIGGKRKNPEIHLN